jgi:MFS family permease
MHLFTAFYFVIVLALEADWNLPYHELIELWTLGALLVGLGALPAGWLGDRWSAGGMMVVYFLGLGLSGILCGLLDGPVAMMVGLASIGLFASIYHPVGIAWLVRSGTPRAAARRSASTASSAASAWPWRASRRAR